LAGAPRGAAALAVFALAAGAWAAAFFWGNGFSGFLGFGFGFGLGAAAFLAAGFALGGDFLEAFAAFDGLRVIDRVLQMRSSRLVKSRRG
jgi:hypothetical protein